MRYSTPMISAFALSITKIAAFPSGIADSTSKSRGIDSGEVTQRQAVTFNPALQYVSTTGKYAYQPPGPTDNRGPCPGLNAMANHGYIPHNGVATIGELVAGTGAVFGMGADLAAFLAIYGAVIDGDLTGFSIGGPPTNFRPLLGILGTPQGLSGSHNKYESDVSPTRGDLYQYGNDYKPVLSQFEDLFSKQPDPATANYNLDILTDFRSERFNQSIQNNPYFFNGPFTGVIVQPAAYTFIYRFMANKSAEAPEGILNQEVLKSFFGVTGSPGSFSILPGQERIPTNWYKRAIGDEYSIPAFQIDLLAAALKYPQFLSIGGNTGNVNTFTGVDITALTKGVYNIGSLTKGNNAACFALQFAQQAAPDFLKGLLGNLVGALGVLGNALGGVEKALGGCEQLEGIDNSQFSRFPGSKGAY